MTRFSDAWLEGPRGRWLRPDACRRVRVDADQRFEHDDATVREWRRAADEVLIKGRRFLALYRRYDPNQPRVPAGSPEGGQWTTGSTTSVSTAGRSHVVYDRTGREPWTSVTSEFAEDGTVLGQTVVGRDGSTIRSEFRSPNDELHAVLLADGNVTTFERSGRILTIVDDAGQRVAETIWTDTGPEAQATVRPAYFQTLPQVSPAVQRAIEAAAALYTWWSSRNTKDQTAVFAFRADDFRPGADERGPAVWVGRLTRDEVKQACPALDEVQRLTDEAARDSNPVDYATPAAYGTAVHQKLKDKISLRYDPDFRAEVSLLKTLQETGGPPGNPQSATYGESGSVRIDVLENTRTGTVCVYDIKTLTPA